MGTWWIQVIQKGPCVSHQPFPPPVWELKKVAGQVREGRAGEGSHRQVREVRVGKGDHRAGEENHRQVREGTGK